MHNTTKYYNMSQSKIKDSAPSTTSLENVNVDEPQNQRPLLTFQATPTGPKCPFGNLQPISFSLIPGGCVWLQGNSGRGKTTLASAICNILPDPKQTLKKLNIAVKTNWDETLIESERCGVLFQQSTLLDELTVGGNLAAAMDAIDNTNANATDNDINREQRIRNLLETVGLDYDRDVGKKPTELSGGMSRRASLALQLAQKKHVIFLDEPFTGLDREAALSIVKELVHLRTLKNNPVAFILISHEVELANMVMGMGKNDNDNDNDNGDRCGLGNGNVICNLEEPKSNTKSDENQQKCNAHVFHGITFLQRFSTKVSDYFFYSLPLILLAFSACGLAISMLVCDTLGRIDVTKPVLSIVDREIRPMIKMLTGQEANSLHLMGVKMKVSSMLNQTVPPAKATLYAIGMAKLFVLEIGPLLTALLLSGRIGGSYAGKVATMQATSQNKLLRTLGISPRAWSYYPSLVAAGISGPLLTVIGTALALGIGGEIGSNYGIGNKDGYWEEVKGAVFPPLRLRWFDTNINAINGGHQSLRFSDFVLTTFSDRYMDAVVEILTYPPVYHFVKALSFVAIIMSVAEICAYARSDLTPREVPR